jgi:hypothetical protein
VNLIAMEFSALFFASGAMAQGFPDVPIPTFIPNVRVVASSPKPVLHRPWLRLDKDVTVLGAFHGAAALMDGITTRRYIAYETDPLDRAFLGPTPTWSRMIPLGCLEVYGAALLAQHMKHSKYKVVRKLYRVPQIGFIVQHTYGGGQQFHNAECLLDARSLDTRVGRSAPLGPFAS